jgi:excisionase family DNA binding protein
MKESRGKIHQKYLRPAEAAEYARVNRATIYRWINENFIKSHRVGGVRLILISDIENMIEKQLEKKISSDARKVRICADSVAYAPKKGVEILSSEKHTKVLNQKVKLYKSINVRVPDYIYDRVQAIASARLGGVKVSNVVREILEQSMIDGVLSRSNLPLVK